MAGQCGPDQLPPGVIALLGGAIRYTLGACALVTPAEMTRPTPCADWDLAALLAHLAASMGDLESALRTGSADPWAANPNGPTSPGPGPLGLSTSACESPCSGRALRMANMGFPFWFRPGENIRYTGTVQPRYWTCPGQIQALP